MFYFHFYFFLFIATLSLIYPLFDITLSLNLSTMELNPNIFAALVVVLVVVYFLFFRGKKSTKTTAKVSSKAEKASTQVVSSKSETISKNKKKRDNKKKNAALIASGAKAPTVPAPEQKVEKKAEPVKSKKANKKKPSSPIAPIEPIISSNSEDEETDDEFVLPVKSTSAVISTTAVVRSTLDSIKDDIILQNSSSAADDKDGWNVVKKVLKKKEETPVVAPTPVPTVAPTSTPAPVVAAPVVELITKEITLESKRLGVIIGKKGENRINLESRTDTRIQVPKGEHDGNTVTISVTGSLSGVNLAIKAINDLSVKGFAAILEPDDFVESYVSVPASSVSDIIGKDGQVISKLYKHTDCRIIVPPNHKVYAAENNKSGANPGKVKIILAGGKVKVAQARALIKDITKYYYSSVVFPNLTHNELSLDKKFYALIIGPKGSEIKHIQNSFKVKVHIPNDFSVNQNVVIVGEPAGVAKAHKHILGLIRKNLVSSGIINENDDITPYINGGSETAPAATLTAETISPVIPVSTSIPVKTVLEPVSFNETSFLKSSVIPEATPAPSSISASTSGSAWLNDFESSSFMISPSTGATTSNWNSF